MCTASHNHHQILAHPDIATSRVAGVSISSFVERVKEENNSVTKGDLIPVSLHSLIYLGEFVLYPYYFLLLDSLGLFSSLHSIVLCSTANLIARKAGDIQPTRFQGRHRTAYIFVYENTY